MTHLLRMSGLWFTLSVVCLVLHAITGAVAIYVAFWGCLVIANVNLVGSHILDRPDK